MTPHFSWNVHLLPHPLHSTPSYPNLSKCKITVNESGIKMCSSCVNPKFTALIFHFTNCLIHVNFRLWRYISLSTAFESNWIPCFSPHCLAAAGEFLFDGTLLAVTTRKPRQVSPVSEIRLSTDWTLQINRTWYLLPIVSEYSKVLWMFYLKKVLCHRLRDNL